MTYSNFIKLLPQKKLPEKMTLKVEIPVFKGFVHPFDFASQAENLCTPPLEKYKDHTLKFSGTNPLTS